jgi:hypothetical protein
VIKTQDSDFCDVLGVYTGSAVGSLTPVASDNGCYGSQVSFHATSGVTYRMAVDGAYGGSAGSFSLDVSAPEDTTPPETTIDSGTSGTVTSGVAEFAFSGADAGSDVASFECSLDAAAFAPCTSPKSFSGLADGPHTFKVRAVDVASNSDASPASSTWTIDTTPPETIIDTAPSGTIGTTSASFTFHATETATFRCNMDSLGWSDCASPQDYAGLADGPHTFQVRATDGVSNTDPSPASRTWTVDTALPSDTTPPETTIDSGPAGSVASTTADFTFSGTDAGSGVASFQCDMDSAGWSSCTSPQSFPSLADSSHTFRARAIDGAGNIGLPATRTWTIDTAAPDTTIDSGPTGTVGVATADFAFSGTDAGSDVASFECSLDSPTAFAACTSPESLAGLANGSHTFYVRAIDVAGNVDASAATRTWTVAAGPLPRPDAMIKPPSATLYTGDNIYNTTAIGQTVNKNSVAGMHQVFTVKVQNDGPVAGTFLVTGAASTPQVTVRYIAGSSGSTDVTAAVVGGSYSLGTVLPGGYKVFRAELTLTPLAPTGSQKVLIGVRDITPLWEDSVAATANPDITPPNTVIDSGPTGTVYTNTADFAFSSEPGAAFQCQLDTGAYAACTSPKSYAGLTKTTHYFRVRAIDAAGNVDATPAVRTWTVKTPPPETTIDSGPTGTAYSSTAAFTFSSIAGATFQCKLDGGPYGSCTSPKTYTGLTVGAHTFYVRAISGGVTDPTPASRTWTVATAP